MNWKSKVCLGTAQFGIPYSIGNIKKTNVSNLERKKILSLISRNRIKYIDTALEYENVDGKLSSSGISLRNFKITTKIPSPEIKSDNYEKFIIKEIKKSLKKLKIKKFYSVLLHDCRNLNKKKILKVKKVFKVIKHKKLSKYFGISIYDQNEFENCIKIYKPDIVQGPLNIFDKTMLKNNFLKKLKKMKIKFFARSIFLQGTLLTAPEELPNYFKPWLKYFIKWDKYCKKYNTSKIQAATNYVLANSLVNKIVVGFLNEQELREFLSIKITKINSFNNLVNFKTDKKATKLLKPYNWNI